MHWGHFLGSRYVSLFIFLTSVYDVCWCWCWWWQVEHDKDLLLQLIDVNKTVSLTYNSKASTFHHIIRLNSCLITIHLQWVLGLGGDPWRTERRISAGSRCCTLEHICRASPGTPSLILHVQQRINLCWRLSRPDLVVKHLWRIRHQSVAPGFRVTAILRCTARL